MTRVRCFGLVVALAVAVGKVEVRDLSGGNCSGEMGTESIRFRGSYESVAQCDTENNCRSSGNAVGL
jgi:hypothetical protein